MTDIEYKTITIKTLTEILKICEDMGYINRYSAMRILELAHTLKETEE